MSALKCIEEGCTAPAEPSRTIPGSRAWCPEHDQARLDHLRAALDLAVSIPEDPPGMWERGDLYGGWADSAAPAPSDQEGGR